MNLQFGQFSLLGCKGCKKMEVSICHKLTPDDDSLKHFSCLNGLLLSCSRFARSPGESAGRISLETISP